MTPTRRLPVALSFVILALLPFPAVAQHTDKLAAALQPYFECLKGQRSGYAVSADVVIEGHDEARTQATLAVYDAESLSLEVRNPQYPMLVLRTATRTVLALPNKGVAFVGEGEVGGGDVLAPASALDHLVSENSAARPYVTILTRSNGTLAALALTKLAGVTSEDGVTWTTGLVRGAKFTLVPEKQEVDVDAPGYTVKVALSDAPAAMPSLPPGLSEARVDRRELERLFARGMRRATEVFAPDAMLQNGDRLDRDANNGQLRWVGDQRLVTLWGTPQQVGHAHGILLRREVRRCADSALYLVGIASTVHTGKWFPDELRRAYARLEKFIPEDHKAELDALADATAVSRDEAKLANVFPELFHCSGFAVFGKATVDGKLYHGRVLDYMTMIGLQDSAATFIVAPQGKIPFANIGYGGFVGSVSGMNQRQISVGEMGARGEEQWDGVPMSTLMRRALEECSTLDDVRRLWRESPRTCEYFYVLADGKLPSAVAVAATPQKIEFLEPGMTHPMLGPGIPDAVVLSNGSRLAALRQRVQQDYGKLDADGAMRLMCRPVAMRSNLHDVLFVPQDGVFYVTHADHHRPAADRPYTRYDLNAILRTIPAAAN